MLKIKSQRYRSPLTDLVKNCNFFQELRGEVALPLFRLSWRLFKFIYAFPAPFDYALLFQRRSSTWTVNFELSPGTLGSNWPPGELRSWGAGVLASSLDWLTGWQLIVIAVLCTFPDN